MKKVLDKTVRDLIDDGADVEINYYYDFEIDEMEALDKISSLTGRNEFEGNEWESLGNFKAISKDERITIRSYYHIDHTEHETEHAQARLTEQERKMKEAGHKESDFS